MDILLYIRRFGKRFLPSSGKQKGTLRYQITRIQKYFSLNQAQLLIQTTRKKQQKTKTPKLDKKGDKKGL